MTIGIAGVVVKRRGLTILDRATLELGPGLHGVIGRNGTGKTTLLRVLAGHVRVDAGTVTGPGATALGRVAQGVRYAGPTIGAHLDVAAIGHPTLDRRLALAILGDAGLGPDTPTKTLSAGQRQLLSVAAALSSGAESSPGPSPSTPPATDSPHCAVPATRSTPSPATCPASAPRPSAESPTSPSPGRCPARRSAAPTPKASSSPIPPMAS